MSAVETIVVAAGALTIAVTIWQVAKRGIPADNGRIDENWPNGA